VVSIFGEILEERKGNTMKLTSRFLAFAGLIVSVASMSSASHAATVTGVVKGVDGAPFQGAFVEAQNTKSRITTIVLSDTHGQYRIEKLPAGDYRLLIRAVGFRTDPKTGVNLAADQKASYDFALQKGMVRWNDISFYQSRQLLPEARGKDLIVQNCSTCHMMQTRMASVTRDADGWRDRVDYMRSAMHFSLAKLTDKDADDISTYLTKLFGPESVLPKSPVDMPGYKETLRPFSSDALNIVYVEYDMPGPNRMPFSAAPDKDGFLWIPDFGVANKITRLDPKTGEMIDYPVPNVGTAAVHSAVPGPDGAVWLAEQASNKVGRWDPNTKTITEYQDAYLPGKEGLGDGGNKHTVRVDPSGNVWASGSPLTKFDPETRKFTRFDELLGVYDVKPDKNGDIWFTRSGSNKMGKVDGKTMKFTEWTMPTEGSFPRRLEIAPDGMIWVGEFNIGKMARFDPANQTFKEYKLPGPDPTPYAMGFDADGYLWYDSHRMDLLGRLDTKTGNVIEYPAPHSELAMREFFRDSQGRMWYGTNPNNKVGYFYLAKKSEAIESAAK
jgi:virginiamycin B lyase